MTSGGLEQSPAPSKWPKIVLRLLPLKRIPIISSFVLFNSSNDLNLISTKTKKPIVVSVWYAKKFYRKRPMRKLPS